MSQNQAPYKAKRRRAYVSPQPPKRCEIVEVATSKVIAGPFTSRREANKHLSKLIIALPKKQSEDELDKYFVRNI